MELYFISKLIKLSEESGNRKPIQGTSSEEIFNAYLSYLSERGLSHSDVSNGEYRQYYLNAELYAPTFHEEIVNYLGTDSLAFRHVAKESRVALSKGDFEILNAISGESYDVSLKNYSNSIKRIQVSSGTFQSLALSFFLERAGVGVWRNPLDGSECSSSSKAFLDWRTKAISDALRDSEKTNAILSLFAELDSLQQNMRSSLIDSDDFKFYNEDKFDSYRKSVGKAGVTIVSNIIEAAPEDKVRARILEMSGLASSKHMLLMGPDGYAHTFMEGPLLNLIKKIEDTKLEVKKKEQSLGISLLEKIDNSEGKLLDIEIPFTINANGAWYKPKVKYEGKKYHAKEGKMLSWGEKRPKKSREIATSINTYLDLSKIVIQKGSDNL
jgi:hypothetical protein